MPIAEVKTFFGDRSAGKRFASQIDKDADIGSLDGDCLEFILALDKAQSEKRRPLSKSDIYQVVIGILGYRKPEATTARRRRNPRVCAHCGCSLERVEEVVRYKRDRYCPGCEPFIDKRDYWAEGKETKEEAKWASA